MGADRGGLHGDHDRGIRNEERHGHNDARWIAHDRVHVLEADALALIAREYERRFAEHGAAIGALESWKNKTAGVGLVVVLFAGLAGAAIAKALGG